MVFAHNGKAILDPLLFKTQKVVIFCVEANYAQSHVYDAFCKNLEANVKVDFADGWTKTNEILRARSHYVSVVCHLAFTVARVLSEDLIVQEW